MIDDNLAIAGELTSTASRSQIWLLRIFGAISTNLRCRWKSLATFRQSQWPKGIEHGVNLLGSFLEGYIGSNQALAKDAAFGKIAQASLEFARGSFATCSDELNWYEHFQLLMRHPVINAGVHIAAWHHYRLPEDLSVPDPLSQCRWGPIRIKQEDDNPIMNKNSEPEPETSLFRRRS